MLKPVFTLFCIAIFGEGLRNIAQFLSPEKGNCSTKEALLEYFKETISAV